MMDFERAAVPYWPIRRRRILRRNLLIVLAVIVAVSGALLVRHRIASQPLADRVFDQVASTVAIRYYDRSFHGVDWKALVDYYRPRVEQAPTMAQRYFLLEQMVARLGDSHTAVFAPDQVNGIEAADAGTLGAVFVTLGKDRVVLRVAPRSPAAVAGLRPGYIVAERAPETPSTTQWHSYLLHVRDPLTGRAWQTTLHASNGASFDAIVPPDLDWGTVAPHIAYLRMASFPNNIEEELGWAVTDIGNNPAMILDLRGNPGGLIDAVDSTAGIFLAPGTLVVTGSGRLGIFRRRFAATADAGVRYAGKLAVLVDGTSESGAEALASALQLQHRGVIVGEPTGRHVLGVEVEEPLADGGLLRVATLDMRDGAGNVLEGRGVTPDIIVARTAADVARGRDPQLHAAIDFLLRNLTTSPSQVQ
jgi:carboxyl-terminal processing protease